MTDPLSDDELAAIAHRASAARAVAGEPWTAWLETAGGLGGSSFIAFGPPDSTDDDEMYLRLFLRGEELKGRDRRTDAVIDFIAHSMADMRRLLTEVRRLKIPSQ